jgi:hypothetical protein
MRAAYASRPAAVGPSNAGAAMGSKLAKFTANGVFFEESPSTSPSLSLPVPPLLSLPQTKSGNALANGMNAA